MSPRPQITMNLKKFAKNSLIAIAVIIAVGLTGAALLTTRAFFVRFPTVQPWAMGAKVAPIPAPENFDRTVEILAGGLRIPTVDGDTTGLAKFSEFRDYLQKSYPVVFKTMEYKLIGDGAIVLIWRGKDSSLPPMMFNAHYDVVPPGNWADAFNPIVANGRITARGSIDMKSTLFALMNAANNLIASGFQPTRDVIFAFTNNEETSTDASATITKYLKSRGIVPDALFDENGMINVMNLDGKDYGFALIGVAEKGYLTVKITVHAKGGHSSIPGKNTAAGAVSEIIRRLEKNQMPARLSGDNGTLLKTLGTASGIVSKIFIGNRDVLKPIVTSQLSESAETNAAIRTTTAITKWWAGDADNVMPNVAYIIVNFRLMPGDSIEDVVKHIKKQLVGFNATVEIVPNQAWEASRVSPTDTHGYKQLLLAIKYVFPAANAVPYTSLAAGDTKNYQHLWGGVAAPEIYRFTPAMYDIDLVHATGESLSLDDFARMNAYYKYLIQNYDER